MFKLVFAYCVIAISLGSTIPDSTQDSDFHARSGRIVGGSAASIGQFRYVVSLRALPSIHFCGGALFSARWVVSAAHCTISRTVGTTIVVAGTISRTTGGTTYSVSRIVNHPSFNGATYANDISLVETSTNVATTVNVAPASLGTAFVGHGLVAFASGWGQTSQTGGFAQTLQFITLATITNADCRLRFTAGNAARIHDNTICTFDGPGRGTCHGDSGNPLASANTIVGVVSWGLCAQGFPDVYARISSHRTWITSITGV